MTQNKRKEKRRERKEEELSEKNIHLIEWNHFVIQSDSSNKRAIISVYVFYMFLSKRIGGDR